jgi:hypothetical protein
MHDENLITAEKILLDAKEGQRFAHSVHMKQALNRIKNDIAFTDICDEITSKIAKSLSVKFSSLKNEESGDNNF